MLSMIIKITLNYWNKKAKCIKWKKNNTSKLIKIDAFLENQSFFIEIYLFLDQKLKVINQLTLYQSTHISTLCSPHTDFLRFQHTNFDFLLFFFKNYIILISILLFYIILWSHIILELRETMFRKPYITVIGRLLILQFWSFSGWEWYFSLLRWPKYHN